MQNICKKIVLLFIKDDVVDYIESQDGEITDQTDVHITGANFNIIKNHLFGKRKSPHLFFNNFLKISGDLQWRILDQFYRNGYQSVFKVKKFIENHRVGPYGKVWSDIK